MSKQLKVAVVGATGEVGRTMIEILEQRQFPVSQLVPLASERSAGEPVRFQGKQVIVQKLDEHDFSDTDIALFSAGGSVSEAYAPKAAQAGCVVIDNTSAFRYQDHIPLVVSEVNPHALDNFAEHNIIANPNCSTMQMLVALAPIQRAVGIARINVATYQSVSGAGNAGIEELARQTKALLTFQPAKKDKFPEQIAFNVLPHIDDFQDNGYTREEMKLVWETQKILEDDEIGVNATAVRVPVFYGHAEAVHLETHRAIEVDRVRELMMAAPGVTLVDAPGAGGYPTPVSHASGQDDVFVGRIRKDLSHPLGIDLWIVSDNVRKGAALNSIQVAELIAERL